MRIARIIDFDHTMGILENGARVSLAHQYFCTREMFGPGHDEECPCLDYLVPTSTANPRQGPS